MPAEIRFSGNITENKQFAQGPIKKPHAMAAWS
jgi:hypothetical protein